MHVEIWSDIACPWCYVGKRRFEAALAAFEHRDAVRVTWRSFDLDPAASLGIRGGPFLLVDRAFGASGAQSPEVLGELLRHAWDARPPLAVVADGEACGPDGC